MFWMCAIILKEKPRLSNTGQSSFKSVIKVFMFRCSHLVDCGLEVRNLPFLLATSISSSNMWQLVCWVFYLDTRLIWQGTRWKRPFFFIMFVVMPRIFRQNAMYGWYSCLLWFWKLFVWISFIQQYWQSQF